MKNSNLPSEHTTAMRADGGPVHEGIADSALVISGEMRVRWISEQEALREPTYTASAEDYARVHSSADSAGDGPEREHECADAECAARNGRWLDWLLANQHRLECAKWNYDADFETEPCTCVHRGADRAREVRDA